MRLEEIRKNIDEIDAQLIELIKRRLACSKQVAEFKHDNNMQVFDAAREKAILAALGEKAGDDRQAVELIWQTLMEQSRARQYPFIDSRSVSDFAPAEAPGSVRRIACQGIAGAYSGIVGKRLYSNAEILFLPKWSDVCRAVKEGEVEYGILPVENSCAGSVHEVYDLLMDGDLCIANSADAHIHHDLIGIEGTRLDEIKEVVSHPQALKQCAALISELGLNVTEMSNTAVAVKYVADRNDRSVAAIGSAEAADDYSLEVLKSDIATSRNNTTRFVSVCREPKRSAGADKISIVFSTENVPGSLYRVLAPFASTDMSLTKIESRPIAGSDFDYLFYADLKGDVTDPVVAGVLATLKMQLPCFKLLGNYPETEINIL